MKLPAWASAHHPIAHREHTLWNRAVRPWRWLWIPLILLPLGCSAMCGLVALPVALEDNTLAGWLFTIGFTLFIGIWALQGFINFGLNMLLSVGAATLIARERESQNWAMLRITILHIPEIIGAKTASLLRQARAPIIAVLALRIVATAATLLLTGGFIYLIAIPNDASSEISPYLSDATLWLAFALGGLVVAIYFIVELIAGVFYNCGIGLLASCFSRTSGTAVGITFVLHFVLWFFVLTPIQQLIFPLIFAFSITIPPDIAAIVLPITSGVISFLLPLVFEAVVALAAFAIVLNQAPRIVE